MQKAHPCQHQVAPHRCLVTRRRLLRLIALGLGLDAAFFDASFSAATSNVRVIHYLPGEHSARDGIFGVGGFPTPLLLQSGSAQCTPLIKALHWSIASNQGDLSLCLRNGHASERHARSARSASMLEVCRQSTSIARTCHLTTT